MLEHSKSAWRKPLALVATGMVAGCLALAGCQSNTTPASSSAAGGGTSDVITVTITDTTTEVSASEVPSGTVTFSVTNNGTAVNEFEILAEDKLQIITERENLTPGTTTEVTTILEPGSYYTASKLNMVGPLVDAKPFTVTDSGVEVVLSEDEQELRDMAVENYTAYIKDQAGQLVAATDEFLAAWNAGNGDLEKAKELYPLARMYYERIEPTAEAFGDIDPNLDLREADAKAGDLEDMNDWKGWHAIEKDLWEPERAAAENGMNAEKRAALAEALKADTQELYDLVYADDFEVSLSDVSNGAIDLMEEVATSKITGEEEAFSHTDLYDFQANVQGAKVAYGNVKALAEMKNPELVAEVDAAFEAMDALLAKYNTGTEDAPVYPSYTDLDANAGEDQEEGNLSDAAKSLADAVNALRAPLGDLTAAILS